jgi:hypothetical protein
VTHPFIADVMRSIREAATSPEAMHAFALRFNDQPLFFPQSSPVGAPKGKKGIRLIGDESGEPKLFCTPDLAAVPRLQELVGGDILDSFGALALYMAGVTRFTLVMFDADSDEVWELTYPQLLAIKQLQLMSEGTPVPSPSATDVARFYPEAFAAWLYDYCLGEKDISKAWLAMCSNDFKEVPDVCVIFDEYTSARHDMPLKAQEGLLTAGQTLLLSYVLDKAAMKSPNNESPIALARTSEPFYDRNHNQGWWARRQRRARPMPIVWLTIDTVADA